MIAIVDYGMGNRRSVEKAFEHLGVDATLTSDQDQIGRASGIVVPGVGAFPAAMAKLHQTDLINPIKKRAAEGVPILGICLGMQLLFESSTEHHPTKGIGLLRGEVIRLETDSLKLPHIGWSKIQFTRPSALTAGLPSECAFYHVHSFAVTPTDKSDLLGVGYYGQPFASVVEHENIFGAQFHPEKSSKHGLELIQNFAKICR